jgi:hypothetical protein
MSTNKPISTRWQPDWLPQWTIGLYDEEIALIRAAMKMVHDNTSSLNHKVAAAGILKEIEEAGERNLERHYQEREREPTPEELRILRDSEF